MSERLDPSRTSVQYAVRKPPDTLRVAILGASYGEGAEVDHPSLHGAILERLLNDELAFERSSMSASTNGSSTRRVVLRRSTGRPPLRPIEMRKSACAGLSSMPA